MTAAVVRDHAIPTMQEEQHLRVPVVGRQRPAVAEYDGLTGAPVLEEQLGSIPGGVRGHHPSFAIQLSDTLTTSRERTPSTQERTRVEVDLWNIGAYFLAV